MTCDRAFFPYATLKRIPGGDPDDARSYSRGFYGVEDPVGFIEYVKKIKEIAPALM